MGFARKVGACGVMHADPVHGIGTQPRLFGAPQTHLRQFLSALDG